MLKKKKLWLALGLIPQIVLVKWLLNYPEFIERYYSEGLYQWLSKLFRFVLGWLPFSFGDLVYGLGGFYITWWLIKHKKRIVNDFKNWLVDVFAAISLIYFAFHLFWGMNYYRLPLHKNLGLNADYTTEQLVNTTEMLISVSNNLHLQITQNDTLKVEVPHDKKTVFALIPKGYNNLKTKFPNLEYYPESTKQSLFSYPLTYMGFSGYLNPLTNEAQVNGKIPMYKFPTTAAHEIAHQLGYAAENEANFIGFMAASSNNDIYIKYCGYTFGLRFCLNEIYRRDSCLFEDIVADVNKGILKNYEESRKFWEAHENPFEPFFKLFYGNFLKANNQPKGMETYSYVVALLVNYLETEGL
ncbi:DUF3810 domain-containing protein [Hyunsoonleella pacifica]|uniref:DUF3810 domain-containing protein n=1 Tax=Hyunsoonleella pacifica TaxID=1080224 RepID=A0A4Q9FQ71_9FLAO|nr:DUF3810 domain-containing protein [Hyunsoonleella pacifica]TBN15366.1 DUF3810 domain-containing protein [Hyunsoonleella pacifica]GGD23446.1 hypothetical protein GCM10011368_26910 [Hyunsoonleella pacifica]